MAHHLSPLSMVQDPASARAPSGPVSVLMSDRSHYLMAARRESFQNAPDVELQYQVTGHCETPQKGNIGAIWVNDLH